jgi:hypothetical protein
MQRRLLYSTIAVLLASGAYWALIHYAGVRSYLGESLLMKIHGAAAMVALAVIGSLLAFHVPSGWAERRSRPSGGVMLAISALLTLTGYLLYYAGAETARDIASYVHLTLGLALPIVLALHLVKPKGARMT